MHVPDERPFTDSSSHYFSLTDKALALVPALLAEKEAKERERREKRKEKRSGKDKNDKEQTAEEAATAAEQNVEISGPKALVYTTKLENSPKDDPASLAAAAATAAAATSSQAAAAAAQAEREKEPETPEQRAKREGHRQEVLRELILTERDYIRDLQIVTKLYMEPLQTEKKELLSRQQFDIIFLNITQLVPVNEMLLGDLEGVLASAPDAQTLGVVFCKLANCFKMYAHVHIHIDISLYTRSLTRVCLYTRHHQKRQWSNGHCYVIADNHNNNKFKGKNKSKKHTNL